MPSVIILSEGKNPYLNLLAGDWATSQTASVGEDGMSHGIRTLPLSVKGLLGRRMSGLMSEYLFSLGWETILEGR